MSGRRPGMCGRGAQGAGARQRCAPGPKAGLLALGLAAALAACAPHRGEVPPPPPAPPVAEPRVSDGAIRDAVRAGWDAAGDVGRGLDATVTDGRVFLTGRARTADQRVEAVRLAWRADGVQEVVNEIQVDDASGLTDAATDTLITTRLRSRLLLDPDIRSSRYSIETVNQTVYIMGRAGSQGELDRVLAHAREVPRVRRVVNHVRL